MLLIDDTELLRDRGYIDGAWAAADSGATFPVHDPATGEVLADVPRMGAAETRRAIEAAAAALPAWRARPARERAAFLRAFSDLMLRHRRDLAMIMTREQGKPLAESDAEIGYAASFLEWFGEEAKRVYGDTIPAPQTRHAHRRAEAAGGRVRRHHAMELPLGHDHAQGRAGAGCGQHDRLQAGRADAALGARAGRARRPRGHARPACSRSSPAMPRMRPRSAAS